MAVAGDEGAEVLFAALAGGGEGEVLGQALDPFGLAARHEEGLAKVHVGDGLGELEAELIVVQERFGEVLSNLLLKRLHASSRPCRGARAAISSLVTAPDSSKARIRA